MLEIKDRGDFYAIKISSFIFTYTIRFILLYLVIYVWLYTIDAIIY